jgi:hypothetical protein
LLSLRSRDACTASDAALQTRGHVDDDSLFAPPQAPEPSAAVPDYDPVAMGRLAGRVQILTVDLLEAHVSRQDDGIIPSAPAEFNPEIGIAPEWEVSMADGLLGCAFTFSMVPDDGPFQIVARFRLLYSLDEGDAPDENDITQFVYWNAVFNAWPYWREYVSSTVNRAHLPVYMVPVMRVPMPDTRVEVIWKRILIPAPSSDKGLTRPPGGLGSR